MSLEAEDGDGMSGQPPPELAVFSDLRAAATTIEQTIRRYDGVLDLRRRQVAGAAAIIDPSQCKRALQETSAGYAADLNRYASELWPTVLAFDVGCAELQAHDANPGKDDAEPISADEGRRRIRHHTDALKMARSARDLVRDATEAVVIQLALKSEAGAALRQMAEVFDQYRAALDVLEAHSLKALERLGADATVIPAQDQ